MEVKIGMSIKLPHGRCEECGELYYEKRSFSCRLKLKLKGFSVKSLMREIVKQNIQYSVWTLASIFILVLHAPFILGVPAGFVFDRSFAGAGMAEIEDSAFDGDNRTVFLKESEYAEFKVRYDPSEEQGFCLFGNVSGSRVYVSDVAWVEDPLMQKEGSINFVCRSELRERAGRLLRDEDFKLVGSVHTHSDSSGECRLFDDSACLSKRDVLVLHSGIVPLMGVYDGTKLRVFSVYSLSSPLDLEIYDVSPLD